VVRKELGLGRGGNFLAHSVSKYSYQHKYFSLIQVTWICFTNERNLGIIGLNMAKIMASSQFFHLMPRISGLFPE